MKLIRILLAIFSFPILIICLLPLICLLKICELLGSDLTLEYAVGLGLRIKDKYERFIDWE
jgi:hypothetical protein